MHSLHLFHLSSQCVPENPKTKELRAKKQDVTLIVVHKASSETYASSIGTAVPFLHTFMLKNKFPVRVAAVKFCWKNKINS